VPSPLAEQALAGTNRQLTLLAAQGLLPLPAGELVTLQVALADGQDVEAAGLAAESLSAMEPRLVSTFIAQDAPEDVQRWFAGNSSSREVIEALLRRRDVPTDVLLQLAPRLGADLQEMLLLRQDRITQAPDLLVALEGNPQLSSFATRRIRELREHLLGGLMQERQAQEAAEAVEEDVPEHVVLAAIEEVRATVPPGDGEVEENTRLTEGQLRQLPVSVRLKLARNAPRTLRQFLIRDSSTLVAIAVLQSNPVSDSDIEQYARSRNVVPDVLEFISKQRPWVGKYQVMLNLTCNPRTPLPIALRLINQVSVRDLRNMGKDRNLPEAVRSSALRLFKVKSA